MSEDYKWLNKKVERSINSLHLWQENPRLDQADNYVYFRDFIEGIIATPSDRKDFLELLKSISTKGFRPFDPIVVWKNEHDNKLYVAEGNRRIAAAKLLLEPTKAPKSIKATVIKLSKNTELNKIKKIYVAIAPSFEDTIWYINQRHVPGSNQKKWSRENHLLWISNLYSEYNKDISLIKEFTNATEGELNKALCVLKLKDRVGDLKDKLTEQEYTDATSKQFPISTFERIVDKDFTQEALGFHFVDSELEFTSDNESFLNAFADLIRRLVASKEDPDRIDSRTLNSVDEIKSLVEKLPKVEITGSLSVPVTIKPEQRIDITENVKKVIDVKKDKPLKGDPKRSNVILSIYELNTDNYRLSELFKELKLLSVKKYPNIAAAAMRVFLDISIKLFIEENELEEDMRRQLKMVVGFIGLNQKLKFIKDLKDLKEKYKFTKESVIILSQLLNEEWHYSLSILNGYVHGTKTYNVNKEYINSFWDFLFPLFQNILDIKENE